jgi:uncharacterized membrane protein
MGLLVVFSLICVVLGFTLPETVFQEVTWFALAAVWGILARIAQAAKHHAEVMGR